MTYDQSALGGRLPLADPATLTGPQRELFDQMMTTAVLWARAAGFVATTDDGRLIGPFNPVLLNPAIAVGFLQLQDTEEQRTSLSRRARQVVILTVGAVWRSDYELYAHTAAAETVGLPQDAVTTLASGGAPNDLPADEQVAHRLARALSTRHRVDEQLYRDAEAALGTTGVFEVAVLTGIYHTVCAILNAFDIPAP